tara:strand:+ start:258 stop:482 length:225 start_codon:yes stop_codon:yes gene_type:complete
MKEKILPFIKKYPMSILLAIIALNLMSIAGSLKPTAKLNQMKLVCLNRSSYSAKKKLKILGNNPLRTCNVIERM